MVEELEMLIKAIDTDVPGLGANQGISESLVEKIGVSP
jgi:hypothetical protein